MGRKGWWHQLQTGEYEETKTNYGDHRAANDRPKKGENKYQPNTLIRLDHKCPNCGDPFRGKCYKCGYPSAHSTKRPKSSTTRSRHIRLKSSKKTSTRSKPRTPNLTYRQVELLKRYLPFYESLHYGKRRPTTDDQIHFVKVCHRKLRPSTMHEWAYSNYLWLKKRKSKLLAQLYK